MADTPTADGGRFDELGVTGLRRSRGTVLEEFLRQLAGPRANATYREMSENHPVIVSALLSIEMYLRQIEWSVEPAKNGSDTDPRIEFLEQNMEDMETPWSVVVAEALTMLPFGFQLAEVCYKQRVGPDETDPKKRSDYTDGKVGWRKFATRSQDSVEQWEWDDDNLLVGAWQRAWPDWQRRFLPMSKCLLFRTSYRKDNPQGRALLRGCFIPWFEQKRIRELQLVGIERDLTGLPRMYVPPEWITDSAYATQLAYAERMVTNVRNNEQAGLILPAFFTDDGKTRVLEFDLIASPGTRQFDLKAEIQWRNLEILQALLMDILLLGHEKIGTQALSENKTDWATKAFEAWLDEIANVINTHEVPRLFRMNGMPTAMAPKITHAPVEKVNLVELATSIKTLADAGMELFPSDGFESFIRRVAGWPELTDDELSLLQQARDASLQQAANPPDPMELAAAKAPTVAPGAKPGTPTPTKPPVAKASEPITVHVGAIRNPDPAAVVDEIDKKMHAWRVEHAAEVQSAKLVQKPTPEQIAKYALDAADDPHALDRYLGAVFDEPEA